jgi:4-diphosphocytidyl-2-C-methyl-D-erythritol kinase
MSIREALAPAKINLGLEILGRRRDGYHELRTVLMTISLHDTLRFTDAADGTDRVTYSGPGTDATFADDLIAATLRTMRQAGADIPPQSVAVDKRIPVAAGLGGASSDAAATLQAFRNELASANADPIMLASSLGSDVPFFLSHTVALASGRGTELVSLPTPVSGNWVLLVTPQLEISNKTSTMYREISPDWWSNGLKVEAFARQFPDIPADLPPNVFERAMLSRFPELAKVPHRMTNAGCPGVSLSGAGPTFFSILPSKRQALTIRQRLSGQSYSLNVARMGPDIGAVD